MLIFFFGGAQGRAQKKWAPIRHIVCLFVGPVITHKPLDRFASKFYWGTQENNGNGFNLVLKFLYARSCYSLFFLTHPVYIFSNLSPCSLSLYSLFLPFSLPVCVCVCAFSGIPKKVLHKKFFKQGNWRIHDPNMGFRATYIL